MKKLLALALVLQVATFACLAEDDSPDESTIEQGLTVCDTSPGIFCPNDEDNPDWPNCVPRKCNKDTHCWECLH